MSLPEVMAAVAIDLSYHPSSLVERLLEILDTVAMVFALAFVISLGILCLVYVLAFLECHYWNR